MEQFDAEKVAQTLGFKDATVARARWNTIKRKKIAGAVASAASPAGVKKGGKGSTPKKGKTAAPTEDGGEEAVESPAKTTPKRGRPKKGKKEVEGADSAAKDDDAGEVAVKGEEEEDSFT